MSGGTDSARSAGRIREVFELDVIAIVGRLRDTLPPMLRAAVFATVLFEIVGVAACAPGSPPGGDEQVTGDVLRPSVFVEGFQTDGDPPVFSFNRVPDAAGVAAEIALAQKLRLPSVKVYDNLTPPVYDAIVEQAHAAGLQVIGHVPREISIEHPGVEATKHRTPERVCEMARGPGRWDTSRSVLASDVCRCG